MILDRPDRQSAAATIHSYTNVANFPRYGGFVVVLALLACADHNRAPAPETDPAKHSSSDVAHYKFDGPQVAGHDLATTIKGLENRIKDKTASSFDLGDLAEDYVKRALIEGDPEDFKRALGLVDESLKQLPTGNGAILIRAKIANAHHEFRDAIVIANDFLKQRPSEGAEMILATAYLALGELPAAHAAAEAATTGKGDPGAMLMRGIVEEAQGREAEAAFDFRHSIELESAGDIDEAARSRALWGRFLIRSGDLVGAKVVLDEALRIAPDDALALAYRAELSLRTGKLDEAKKGFERAFVVSRQVRYLIDLARAQELASDKPGADSSRTQVEKLVRADLAENGVGHKLDLVEVLTDRGTPKDLAEAITLGNEELAHRPSANTHFQLARAMYRGGAPLDDARAQIQEALSSGVRDARIYELAARLDEGPRKGLYMHEADKLDPGHSGWRALGMSK